MMLLRLFVAIITGILFQSLFPETPAHYIAIIVLLTHIMLSADSISSRT